MADRIDSTWSALRASRPETKVGDRVELVYTEDAYTRLVAGDRGTVTLIDDVGTVHIEWDNGSALGLVARAGDVWKVVS